MKKILLILFFISLIYSENIDFTKYNCSVIKVGESIDSNSPCIVFDDSKDKIYWVRLKVLPVNTGDPKLDEIYNNSTFPQNYVGCNSYENFKTLKSGQFTGEDFWDVELKPNDEVWYLVVGSCNNDFCYVTVGGNVHIDTILIRKQNDADSHRDSCKKFPVNVEINREYFGESAYDYDWYIVKLPKNRVVKFSISYIDGPRCDYRLDYGLGSGGISENQFLYCTKNHKTTDTKDYIGDDISKKAYFPKLNETAYCYIKANSNDNKDFVYYHFYIKPPIQYPPIEKLPMPKEKFVVPRYKFSFSVVEKE